MRISARGSHFEDSVCGLLWSKGTGKTPLEAL